MSCNADIKPIADARRRPVAWLALGLLGASIAGCSAAAGISGEQVPCSSSSQCYGGEVCFLGECRGGSFALASVLAEVRPPSGTAYGVQQVGAIDLRQSVVVNFALSPALGVSGSVSWDFKREGIIEADPPAGADAESAAIEAGAQDLEPGEEGATRFFTEPSDLDSVTKALAAQGWRVSASKPGWRAKNPIALDEAARKETEAFLQALDADDDVQEIYAALA